jgi:UDP-glucose 4-epimerase
MRCLVTGASGFIGSHLVRLLVAHGATVAVILRPGSDPWRLLDVLPRLEIITGDLTNLEQTEPACIDFSPQAIFHLAWDGVGQSHRDDPQQVTRNLPGTLRLVEIARAAGSRRWIGLGSQAEYGPSARPLTEDHPARPITTYGAVKLAACLLTNRLCESYGIEWAWPRLVATYGPMDVSERLIPYVIGTLLRGDRPRLTAGDQCLDYLYVDDVAEAIYAVATTDGANGAFNLGSGQPVSVRSIAERLRDCIDPLLPLGFDELTRRPDQPALLQADASRLRTATGWAPGVELDEGLQRTVEWLRAFGQ